MMNGRSGFLSVLPCVLFLLLLPQSGPALELLEPGYVAVPFSSYTAPGIDRTAWDMVFAPDGNLYATHLHADSVWRIAPDGTASEFVTGLVEPHGIVWAGGSAYGDFLYVSGTYVGVARVGLDGSSAAFASRYCAGTLGLDRVGHYGGYMYTTTGCQDHTYVVYPGGGVALFSDWPTWIDGGGPHNITFDTGGRFGNLFYIASAYWSSQAHVSGVFVMSPSGVASRFAPDIVQADGIKIDEAGDFDGDMFVVGRSAFSLPTELWRVKPDGTATRFATLSGRYPRGMAFGPDGALYVSEFITAENRVIVTRISQISAAIDIPTLGEWGLIAFASLLAMAGIAQMRRRRQA